MPVVFRYCQTCKTTQPKAGPFEDAVRFVCVLCVDAGKGALIALNQGKRMLSPQERDARAARKE